MDDQSNNSLDAFVRDIQKAYDAKNIDQTDAMNYIKIIEYKLRDKISQTQKLSGYKLIDKLIHLLPPSREKWETKIKNLKMILESESDNAATYSMIADCYEIIGEHQRAIEYFKKAYDLDPNPFYLSRIGMRYRLLNDNKSAIQYYTSCIEKGDDSADTYKELGEAYLATGDIYKARFNLNKALNLGLDEEDGSRARKSLNLIEELNDTTDLLNNFLAQKNSKPIIPSYLSPGEGKFETYKGNQFNVWRFPAEEYEGTEVIRIYDNDSNAIGFWFGEEDNIILFGFVFRHKNTPKDIQYLVTIKPPRFEELDTGKMIPRENSDIMDPQKRNIDPLLTYKEFKKLKINLKTAGIEIISDFTDIFKKNN